MLTNEQIQDLINDLPNESYRRYVSNKPVTLSAEMAAALGSDKRHVVAVLQTVTDAIASKLFIQLLTVNDAGVNEAVNDWLTQNRWENIERALYNAVVRDGRTFLLTTYEDIPRLYQLDLYDGRQGAIIIYSDKNKRAPLYGLNTWYANEKRYLDVYYPDRIEKYIYDPAAMNDEWTKRRDSKEEQWPIDWTDSAGDPLGIALVEYSIGESDLSNGAVQVQHDINNAIMDMLAVSRNMGWPQRYLKGSSGLRVLTNPYGGIFIDSAGMPIPRSVKYTPGSIAILKSDEELGQLAQAEPNSTTIDMLLHILQVITTVPTHYFSGDWPSGAALIQSESRLNHKVEAHQGALTPSVESMVAALVRLSNTFGSSSFTTDFVTSVFWHSPQILTEELKLDILTRTAQALTLLSSAGAMSVETMIRTAYQIIKPDATEQEIQAEIARAIADKQFA